MLAGLLAALTILWLAPGEAGAHAGFAESDPAPNSVLEVQPQQVTIRFTEPLERSYTTAELYDQAGALVAGTTVGEGSDDYELVLSLPPELPDGTYTVLWRTLSTADGHTAQNYFAFTVGEVTPAAAVPGSELELDDAGPPHWVQAASRWAALLGLAAVVAAWPAWLLVIRPAIEPGDGGSTALVVRMRRFTMIALGVALAGNLVALAVQAAALTGGSLAGRIWDTLRDTRYGELWLLRVAALAALALSLHLSDWRAPRRRALPGIASLILSVAAVVPFSYVAHASAQVSGRSTALVYDAIHVLAASLWIGGLFVVCAVLLPHLVPMDVAGRRQVLSEALPRFSTMSLVAWTALVLTGAYSAWLHVGGMEALVDSSYGTALLVKLALLVPILLLATFNLFFVTARLRSKTDTTTNVTTWTRRFALAVGVEALIAIAVLLAVGSLTARSPAREAQAAPTGASQQVALIGGAEDATMTLTPGTPGPNLFEVTLGGTPLPHETVVLLRVESQAQDTGEKDLTLEHGGGSSYSWRGSELSIAGTWDFQLIVRPPSASEWRAFGSVELKRTASDGAMSHWVFASPGGAIGMLVLLAGAASLVGGWLLSGPGWRWRLYLTGATLLALGGAVLAVART